MKNTKGGHFSKSGIHDGMVVELKDRGSTIFGLVLAQSIIGAVTDNSKFDTSYGSLPISEFDDELTWGANEYPIIRVWRLKNDDFRTNLRGLLLSQCHKLLRNSELIFDREDEYNNPEVMIEVDGKEYSLSTLKKMIQQYSE